MNKKSESQLVSVVPCDSLFKLLAIQGLLLDNLQKNLILEPAHLSMAAEYLGESDKSEEAFAKLKELVRHPNAITREGALLGLWHFGKRAADILNTVANSDNNETIRRIAAELLNDIYEGK